MATPEPDSSTKARTHTPANIPALEWIVGGLGALLVGATLFFLLHEALAGDRSPADIKVSVRAILPVRNGYLVQFRARNEGGETAAEVLIEGKSKTAAGDEEAQATIDFIPPKSERLGALIFEHEPRSAEMTLRAAGYRKP